MNSENKDKKWVISTLVSIAFLLIMFGAITVYIDPFFHYHAPLEKYEYPINNERYQNDGIIRQFDYEAVITGTSMTENFKTSEAERLFGMSFVKVPFSGARYKEVNDNLKRAYEEGKKIDCVIRCLDYRLLIQDKDAYRDDIDYPTYLFDDNYFNDLNYILNKEVLFKNTLRVIEYTKRGEKTTSFDIYSNWNGQYEYGKKWVLETYTLEEKDKEDRGLTESEYEMCSQNIDQNVIELINAHPETTFYLFFPPYSICYWDKLKNDGKLAWHLEAEEIAIRKILKCANVKLFSFCNNFELVCNLDNYKDSGHYGQWVNSWILEWMANNEYVLTEENYEEYLEEIKEFYYSYDYKSLHE